MKKLTVIFTVLTGFLPMICFSQTLYRTYYDYGKQHVHEEYYANSYGVKNGAYKEYSEYGGVLQEGTYKDDKKTGKWITRTDKGKLDKVENYKDDKLNGSWISYYYDDGAKYKEGNFTDDVPTGNWYKYSRIENVWNDVPKSAFIGSGYVKVLKHYLSSSSAENSDPDQEQEDDIWGDYGNIINTYYPSGNKFQEGHYVTNLNYQGWIGDYYLYYPNGKLKEFDENDTVRGNYHTIIRTLYHKEWAWPGGSKDSIAFYKAQVEGEQKAAAEQNKKAESEQRKQDSITAVSRKEAELRQHRQDSLDAISRKKAELEKGKRDSLSVMQQQIGALYNKFQSLYVGTKQSTLLGVPLVDKQTQKPIMKTVYPNGEYLFLKSDTLIKFLYKDCQNTSDIGSQLSKSNTIIGLLNKLISFSATDLNGNKMTDTKDLDKQMKKAATMDDIKKVVGL
jgi:antitoxin component YwqK of YwqJK toxin-antitoxin module